MFDDCELGKRDAVLRMRRDDALLEIADGAGRPVALMRHLGFDVFEDERNMPSGLQPHFDASGCAAP
jgi:hypothetical protein